MSLNFLGKGFSFPLQIDNSGCIKLSEEREKIQQSILLILSTAKGARMMRPEFGCAVHDFIFEPNSASLRGLIAQEVQLALIEWEPRIQVDQVTVETEVDQPSKILVSVKYTIRNKNTPDNLVYPFYLHAGQS